MKQLIGDEQLLLKVDGAVLNDPLLAPSDIIEAWTVKPHANPGVPVEFGPNLISVLQSESTTIGYSFLRQDKLIRVEVEVDADKPRRHLHRRQFGFAHEISQPQIKVTQHRLRKPDPVRLSIQPASRLEQLLNQTESLRHAILERIQQQ